jgi:hypothetical protein
MKSKLTLTLITLATCAITASIARADTLADWTFENAGVASGTGTSFTYGSADSGVAAAGSSETGLHANSSSWTFAAGPGSARALNANNWSQNDYFQFSLSSANYSGLSLGWDQMGSGTGPRDFALAYSTDGTNFTNFTTYTVSTVSWSSSQVSPPTASHYSFDLSGVTALNNQSTIYFRLVDNSTTAINGTGTVGTSGTGRVDNFTVSATAIAVPEPASFAMAVIGAGLLVGALRFRRSR